MNEIVIYGAGGMGREILWLIESINELKQTWKFMGFIDDAFDSTRIKNNQVLGNYNWLKSHKKEVFVVCAIGDGSIRKSIYTKLKDIKNVRCTILIDPSVNIDKSVKIGNGSIICRNSIITVDSDIGSGVYVNTGVTIGHDSVIGDYTTLLTNSIIAGNVNIGDKCSIGSGAFVLHGISIAPNTVVAPLTSVLRNIDIAGVYSGNPARCMIKK